MNTHFLMIQDSIKRILSIALFIILARVLDQNTFGHYQQIMLVISFLAMICTAGFPIALSYFYGQEVNSCKQRGIFQRFFIYQLFSISVGILAYFLLSEFIAMQFKNIYLDDYALYIMVIFAGIVIPDFFRNASVLFNTMKSFTIITSSIQIIAMLITIYLAVLMKDIEVLIIITAISSVFLVFSLFAANKNRLYPLGEVSSAEIKTKVELKYIIAMSATSLVGVVNSYTDQITASILLSPLDYSLLKVGAFQIPFISIITGSILTAMIPVVSNLYKKNNLCEIENLWALSIEKATVLLVPIVIFCMVFGKEIIIGFFGSDYVASALIFQIYMFQWLRAVVVFGGVMGAIGLEKELFKNTILITVLNVLLNIFMVIKFGILGAAITTTAMNYFGGYLLIRKINKVLPHGFFSYFPIKSYLFIFSISLILALVIKNFVPISNVMMVMVVSVLYYIFVLSVWIISQGEKITLTSFKRLL